MWKEVDEKAYYYGLEVLPPAVWLQKGFLVGEPMTHRTCKVTNVVRAAYTAFVSLGGKYYECTEAMTGPEFRALEVKDVLNSLA